MRSNLSFSDGNPIKTNYDVKSAWVDQYIHFKTNLSCAMAAPPHHSSSFKGPLSQMNTVYILGASYTGGALPL